MHTVAIIFIPPDHPLDGYLVLACVEHVIRRGYQLLVVLRSWDTVAAQLAVGAAQVAVLATRTHRAGEADRVEVVDEEQSRSLRRYNAAIGRHQVPALPTDRWIADAGRRNALYDTAPLLPRGNDGGFAERFLEERRARDT